MTEISADKSVFVPPSSDVRELIERDLRAQTEDTTFAGPMAVTQDVIATLKRSWMTFAGALVVVFVVVEFLASPILHMHSQVLATREFSQRLTTAAGAIGHPDLSPLPNQPLAMGTPVALVQIPSLGVEQVVVEGVNGQQLQGALGHVAGTAGVSESGVSVIAGRRTTWGAPFASLPSVIASAANETGTAINVTTLAGRMTYHVTKVAASAEDIAAASAESQVATLVLATSAPAGVAARDFYVIAKADKAPFVSTPQNRSTGMGLREGDMTRLPGAAMWLIAAVIALAVARTWTRRQMFPAAVVWALTAPAIAVAAVMFARYLDSALPPTL